ncbi:MAG: hypothetical protein AB8B59_05400 [Maribacter sp.]
MDKNKNNKAKFAIGLGIPGLIAGIFLIFFGNTVIGVSSSISSIGIVYLGLWQLEKT